MVMKKSPRGLLISFSGIDGSGKTTLAKDLIEIMKGEGIHCKYVYGRLEPFLLKPLFIIGRKTFLRKEDISADYPNYSSAKRRVIKQHSFLFSIYRGILSFDYSLQLLLKIRLPLLLGTNIICDRYVYDTAISDLSADADYTYSETKRLVNHFFHIFPKPNMAFLLDLPEEVAYQRKSDTPSVEYLKERRSLYLDIAKEYGMIILDGLRRPEDLLCEVQKKVWQRIQP